MSERLEEDVETVTQEDDLGEDSLEEDMPSELKEVERKQNSVWQKSRISDNTIGRETRLRSARKP